MTAWLPPVGGPGRVLTERGLGPALSCLAERAPVPVGLTVAAQRLPAVIETAVYFICSEALANVGKYAHASRADVAVRAEGDLVTVLVVDDGVGGADLSAGSGLKGLADRVEALGGRFRRLARAVAAGMWLAAFGFGLLSLRIARSHPGATFGGTSWPAGLAELAAGWAVIGAGFYVWRRRGKRSGLLLAAAGVAWFFPEWDNPGIGAAAAFTFGLVTYALAAAVVAHAVLAYPSDRLSSPLGRLAVTVAYADAALILGLLPALATQAAAGGVTLDVRRRGNRLVVDVSQNGAGQPDRELEARLTGLADRVGALDGQVRVGHGAGGGSPYEWRCHAGRDRRRRHADPGGHGPPPARRRRRGRRHGR